MQTQDILGLVIVLALLFYWLIFRSDSRVPIIVALALVLMIVGFMVTGYGQIAEMLGNVFFYILALGVAEMAVDSYLDARAKQKGNPRREYPFLGEVPEWLKWRRG